MKERAENGHQRPSVVKVRALATAHSTVPAVENYLRGPTTNVYEAQLSAFHRSTKPPTSQMQNSQLAALLPNSTAPPIIDSLSSNMGPTDLPKPPTLEASTSVSSVEHMELQNFAYGLGSYSVAPETDKAEQGTRQEAELLMSLCSSPVHIDKADIEAISASESDFSYHSDSSGSRRDNFTFVCPSFSLENSEMALRRMQHNEKVRRANATTTTINNNNNNSETSVNPQVTGETPAPALLLKRPLKVDDRDAYRLSTEAMARNLSKSMKTALDWRIDTWMHSLSLSLVKEEKKMMEQGAPETEIRTLLNTSEALLLTHLRALKSKLQVTGAGTSFRVLEKQVEIESHTVVKKRRLSNESEEPQQLYTVTHELIVDGIVNLETPAGHSEVILEIPGTMSGTFVSTGDRRDVLQSVNLDVETAFLAAMIEKASRKLVRESVACMIERNQTAEGETTEPVEAQQRPLQTLLQTPTTTEVKQSPFAPEAVRAALITPRTNNFETPTSEEQPVKFLLPIPDDLNDLTPSRISPQPKSPTMGPSSTHLPPQTPKPNAFSGALALVSPPLKETTDYHEVPENSPALPMLVEVACREFRSD